MKKGLIIALILTVVNQAIGQNYKFGKVSKEELKEEFYPLDSTVNAAYLYKQERVYYEYDGTEGWRIMTEVHERIKIYNEEGFDYATKKIRLYRNKTVIEEVKSLKGVTYTIENGKISTKKLAKNQVFKERESGRLHTRKFTMPALKKGAVVEWKYKIVSPFYTYIDELVLQQDIPIMQLNVSVKIPEYFKFKSHLKGFLPINLVESTNNRTFQYSYRSKQSLTSAKTEKHYENVSLKEHVFKVVDKNIPALIKEDYVGNINNYRSSIQLELSYIKRPQEAIKYYSTTWNDVSKKIYESSIFGVELRKKNYFKDDISIILAKSNDPLERLNLVFSFVKSKVKWNEHYGKFTQNGVKKAYEEGVGNVAEINLMLVSMLRESGLDANPVLLSTRKNGIPMFPTSNGFNYVIAAVELNGTIILLDATEVYSVPNVLPLRDLNWRGRVVKKGGVSSWVNLVPQKRAVESRAVNIVIGREGFIEGMQRTNFTDVYGLNYRNNYGLLNNELNIERVEEDNELIEIIDFKVLNNKKIYKPVVEMFKFSSEDLVDVVGDKLYFKPLLFNAIIKTPFSLERRQYPIDFGTSFIKKDAISFTIPDGYVVEFVPEKLIIGLSDKMGVYRFNVDVVGNKINILSKLEINSAVYPALNYSEIKEFYKMIVNKNLEQIVLKKVG